MKIFGAGDVIVIPKTDAYGNAIAIPTPVHLGILQEYGVDESYDTKMLYGNLQMPVATYRGKGKYSVDVKFASINMTTLNNIYRGQLVTNGLTMMHVGTNFAAVPIPVAPYQIIPTVESSGIISRDLGVEGSDGSIFTAVQAAGFPAQGQYMLGWGIASGAVVSGGTGFAANDFVTLSAAQGGAIFKVLTVTSGAIATMAFTGTGTSPGAALTNTATSVGGALTTGYTTTGAGTGTIAITPTFAAAQGYIFSAADRASGLSVYPSYEYTASSTIAQQSTVLNLPMGSAPYVEVHLFSKDPISGALRRRKYYSALCEKMKTATKQDDVVIAEASFSCFSNNANQIYDESYSSPI